MFKASPDQTDCARCHTEHHGQKFPLVRLDRKAFQHAKDAGFPLEGKHRALNCEACHTPKKMTASAKAQIKVKDHARSFLGLRRDCLYCHSDPHKAQLGADCLRCHSQDAWKPVTRFDHGKTEFPLTGLHQTVVCVKCHVRQTDGENASGASKFKGVAFATCQSCHRDPHQGAFAEAKFRGGCDSCHTTASWRKATPAAAGFSHEKTEFPLAGKHAAVGCARCHKDSNFQRDVAHDKCQPCHDDVHRGQFAARAGGSDCGPCHNENGFKPALFALAAHQKTAFPLGGKHADVPCAKCHTPQGHATVYRTRLLTCPACHADSHRGQFALLNNDCESCHKQRSFRPAVFDVARHSTTRFALTGKHAQVACAKCHTPMAAGPANVRAKPALLAPAVVAEAARRYHFASMDCASCHKDPHQTKTPCADCHNTESWKRVKTFDHTATRFRLDGAHEKTACSGCHLPLAATQQAPHFGNTASDCGSCHEKKDIHAGQFRSAERMEDCSTCHTPAQWKLTSFPHDQTRFPLDRAHYNVACAKCHKGQQGSAIRTAGTVIMYRNTPVECIKCH